MTDRTEIERLLQMTGRTLEGLPERYDIVRWNRAANMPGAPLDIICHQSDVIELLVGALRDALEKPMQKPLTLEELKKAEVVWIEASEEDKPYPAFADGISDKSAYFIVRRGTHVHAFLDQFGSMWRCWGSKPTDEERKAAAWES